MYGEWERAKDPKWRQISRYLEKSYPSDDVAAGNIDLEDLVDGKLPSIDRDIEVDPPIPPESPGQELMNEHKPTETPNRAQDDRMDEEDIAEIFAPSEAEVNASIADFRMLNALIAAGVDRVCAVNSRAPILPQ